MRHHGRQGRAMIEHLSFENAVLAVSGVFVGGMLVGFAWMFVICAIEGVRMVVREVEWIRQERQRKVWRLECDQWVREFREQRRHRP